MILMQDIMRKIHRRVMDKIFKVFAIACMVFFIGCTQRSDAVSKMVDELNSEKMQQAERQTGLFSGSKANIDEDTLMLTFYMVDGLSLETFDEASLPVLRQSAIDDFRKKAKESSMHNGLQELAKESMLIKMTWRDTSGRDVSVVVDPKEALK